MDTLTSLINISSNLNIYNPCPNTLIYAELSALAEGINIINQELNALERECFTATAESYGLEYREHISGVSRSGFSLQSRREMLMYLTGVTSNDFTRASMERAMISCGMRASVIERPDEKSLYIGVIEIIDGSLTEEQIKSAALEFLPLHLSVVFDFRNFSWSLAESKNMTFADMDGKQKTWEQIDKYKEV